jgi:hypothetical protein
MALEDDRRQQTAEINRDAELMEQLLNHPGWKRYISLVESVGQNYFAQVAAPLENIFEATKGEYAKGTLNGLTLATSLPRSKIEESKSLRNPSNEEDNT